VRGDDSVVVTSKDGEGSDGVVIEEGGILSCKSDIPSLSAEVLALLCRSEVVSPSVLLIFDDSLVDAENLVVL
jgi:hypothetical protein